VFGTNHEGKHFGVGGSARPLTADINEDGTTLRIPVHLVHPISLLIRPPIILVKMINPVSKTMSIEVIHRQLQVVPAGDTLGADYRRAQR
jgi:hypothetical protein